MIELRDGHYRIQIKQIHFSPPGQSTMTIDVFITNSNGGVSDVISEPEDRRKNQV